eukprot:CAMPEP_0177653394 /NCGR_PEP_ID=MMETSP0447-20121125/13712_1 /TAXON_ID=0 /ORGANISM="Stygamoeba regulata, Strain BSH-02190019" /LENGTH=126 /DNA_ID=CAMNT_0019156847 /DNA_START=103 /DNA_END=483 /DNA_ORIENTATION=+
MAEEGQAQAEKPKTPEVLPSEAIARWESMNYKGPQVTQLENGVPLGLFYGGVMSSRGLPTKKAANKICYTLETFVTEAFGEILSPQEVSALLPPNLTNMKIAEIIQNSDLMKNLPVGIKNRLIKTT